MTIALRLSGGLEPGDTLGWGLGAILWGGEEILWGDEDVLWGPGDTLGWDEDILGYGFASTTNADPALSLGGGISTVAVNRDLFGDMADLTGVTYRCIYVTNLEEEDEHLELPDGEDAAYIANLKVYLVSETPSPGTTIALGWGAAGKNADELPIADENDAPPGVVFTAPLSALAATGVGSFAAGERRALWIRITVGPDATPSLETFQIRIA
jgi:hypothetical protein